MSPNMFCHGSVSVHNVLRTFRSHKNLRCQQRLEHQQHQDLERQQYHQLPVHQVRPVPNMVHHPRRPSEASSIETITSDLSFTRPSTSRTDKSIEINPLRLHPPTEELSSPRGSLRSPPRHHYMRHGPGHSSDSASSDESVGMERPALNFQDLQPPRTGSLEVYDGFDFGFDNRTPGPGRQTGPAGGDDYFGMQPRSHWSRSPTPTPGTGEEEDDMDESDPTPGPGRIPGSSGTRLRPHEAINTAEYFIKRGDWKRRGIVFTPSVPMATEEECFDL